MKMSSAKKWRLALNMASVIGPVVALGAACLAYRASGQNTSAQYVAVAVSIVRETPNPGDLGLRNWAVDVLQAHSDTKFSPTVEADLRSGQITLPAGDIVWGQGTVGR
jgi:hypothetical protein